jgi:hypothetical protein
MRRTLLRGLDTWEFATGLDPLPAPAERFPDEAAALRFLRPLAAEAGTEGFRDLLGAESPWLDVRRMDDARVADLLARELVSGEVRVARRPLPAPSAFPVGGPPAGAAGQPTAREWEALARAARPLPAPRPAPPPAEPAAEPAPPDTDWIEVRLVGEDGSPIAGERWRVTLPDGSRREGVTDRDGLARLEGIPSGSCKVTFPELDRDAWVPL